MIPEERLVFFFFWGGNVLKVRANYCFFVFFFGCVEEESEWGGKERVELGMSLFVVDVFFNVSFHSFSNVAFFDGFFFSSGNKKSVLYSGVHLRV